MRPQWWGAITGLLLGAALGAGLLLVVGRGGGGGDEGASAPAPAPPTAPADVQDTTAAPAGVDPATGRDNAIVTATRRAAPAVVSINVIQQQTVRNSNAELLERLGFYFPRREYVRQVQNMGSGVIVSADGLVVTNQHVVDGALQIIVTLSDGRQFPAQVVDEVARYDLAVLQIPGDELPVAPMAAADAELQIGEWAIAIGSPFGYLLADTQPTVTVGVISAVNRDIKRAEQDRPYLDMIQTDAAINPGNSGGPLVNTRGEVVGINTFIFSESGGSVGIGFAVPVGRVRTVLEEIRRYGRYRDMDLGLSLAPLSPGLVRLLNLQVEDMSGALVVGVRPDSPSWRAGLRPNDILREIEGRRVTSLGMIERLIYDKNVGDRLDFRAERDGEEWHGSLDLEERKADIR